MFQRSTLSPPNLLAAAIKVALSTSAPKRHTDHLHIPADAHFYTRQLGASMYGKTKLFCGMCIMDRSLWFTAVRDGLQATLNHESIFCRGVGLPATRTTATALRRNPPHVR